MRYLLALVLVTAGLAQEPATPPPAQAAATPAESTAPTSEPWLTGSIDVGYRWLTDVAGSFPTYRSVVNLGEGPKLFGLDFTVLDPKRRLFDRLDVRGYGWGGDPYNTAHADARKGNLYSLTFDYRNISYFNALPSFANPLAPGGFDEQSFDIQRRMYSGELDLMPGRRITPYFAFDRNSGYGNGIATWLVDQSNSYAVPTLLRDGTNNYRGGVRFEYNRFHVTLEQGGTTFKDDTQASEDQPNSGDRTTTLGGQKLVLNSLQQIYGIRGDSIYERGLATATPAPWISLSGQFLFSQPTTDVQYSESALGNFVLPSTLLPYSGISSLASGTAKQPHVTANGGFELRPWKRLRIVESVLTDHYHDASFGLLSSTLTSKGASAIQSTSQPGLQVVNYNQEEVNAIFEATSKITLRGGYRHVWGDATVRAGQLSQTGTLASGELRRDVGLAGATFHPWQKLRVNLEYEGGLSDAVYFRNSLNDYHRARARAQYQLQPDLTLNFNFTFLNTQNPASDVRSDYQVQDESLAITWTPNSGKRITLLGEYDHFQARSDINYLTLPFFSVAESSYRDYAHIATSQADLSLPGYRGLTPKLGVGGSLFISSGSRPTRYYQPLIKLSLPLEKRLSWNTEWRYYGMGEQFYLYEGFRTHIFTTGLRITR
jgi:hypothetical protein